MDRVKSTPSNELAMSDGTGVFGNKEIIYATKPIRSHQTDGGAVEVRRAAVASSSNLESGNLRGYVERCRDSVWVETPNSP